MISIEELYQAESQCCGCGSCADACPKQVLSMKADKSGFYYPTIEHGDRCIDCRLCITVCPEKHYQELSTGFSSFHAGSFEREEELLSCASGGLATAISRKMILDGGVVYGCSYAEDWRSIEYRRATVEAELDCMKTSKYAQSRKGAVYRQIIQDLNAGKKVLFIGLPCDVLAVRTRTPQKLQEKLFLVELVCHGPTSQEVHRQYLEKRVSSQEKLVYFSTRAKKNGEWKPFYICARFADGSEIYEQFHKSAYGAAFRYLKRPSCYTCQIKGEKLAGDLMIGDYHYVEEGMKGYNRHGVSSALVHNPKGDALLEGLDQLGFRLIAISARGALGNGAILKAIPAPEGQAVFRSVFEAEGLEKAANLGFVRKLSFQRAIKQAVKHYGVRIKRTLFPSTRPQD